MQSVCSDVLSAQWKDLEKIPEVSKQSTLEYRINGGGGVRILEGGLEMVRYNNDNWGV